MNLFLGDMIHFQGKQLKFVLLPSKKGSTLKGKNLLLSGQILLFEVDIFSEGIWYTGKQMGNHKKIFLLSKMFKKKYQVYTFIFKSNEKHCIE